MLKLLENQIKTNSMRDFLIVCILVLISEMPTKRCKKCPFSEKKKTKSLIQSTGCRVERVKHSVLDIRYLYKVPDVKYRMFNSLHSAVEWRFGMRVLTY